MKKTRGRGSLLALVTGLAFAAVVFLIWATVLRERETRRLYLEYESFRASAALLDAYRESPNLLFSDERVIGFGLYRSDGLALVRRGSAPESFDPRRPYSRDFFEARGDSFVLARSLGPGMQGMGRMPGMMPGEGPGRNRAGGGMAAPGQDFDPAAQPRSLWIEYGLAGFNRGQALLYGGASAASLALAGLYLLFLALNHRNAELAERDRQNRELVQLGEAARTLVHEIKNPLGIIRVQAASLRRLDPESAAAKAAEKGAAIDDEVERLAGLADRIREFLKGGEGEPRELELGAWLGDYADRYSGSEEGPWLDLGEVAAGALAKIDPERLSLALDNLVMNAREAGGGNPSLLSLAARGRQWEISVADRGPGVPPELVGRLFEPFFTTKEKGSGIGLALARRVAEAAGGALEYRPRPGGGSIFSMLLPIRR